MPKLETPPAPRTRNLGRSPNPEMVAAARMARKHPGEWVRLNGTWSNSLARTISKPVNGTDKRPLPFRGADQWEAVTRRFDTTTKKVTLYVRLVPGQVS